MSVPVNCNFAVPKILLRNIKEKGKEIRIAMFFLGLVWPRGTRLSLRTVTATATHTKECKSREVTLMLLMPPVM